MATSILQSAQRLLARYGLVPKTRMARFCLTLALALVLWTLIGRHHLGVLYSLTVIVFMGALLALGVRTFTRRFMWSLRNRLIVTYVFIGVIPLILLATMGIVAGYLFAGQFSTFVVTTDMHNELRRLESSNRTLAHQIAAVLRSGGKLNSDALGVSNEAFPGRRVTAYYHAHSQLLAGEHSAPESAPPPRQLAESLLILDNDRLFLRAINRVPLSTPDDQLVVVSSVPLDPPHLESIVANMGVITLYGERGSEDSSARSNTRVTVNDRQLDVTPKVTCGSMPPPMFRLDMDFAPFVTILDAVHWKTGEPTNLLLTVRTRPSLLYGRLFRTLGDTTNLILVALAAIAVIFALIEVAAFIIGVRLTRTMTSSVSKLYNATQYVNRGDLSHRISVSSNDQLASLESSFNSMTASLEKLIAEQKEKQRIESELFIAKEVQDLLFPRDAADLDGLELHGICRPARTVSGDYYDFLPVGPSSVGLAVGDISGKGISAALMMATVHAFVRAHTLVERVPSVANLAVAGYDSHSAAPSAFAASAGLSANASPSPGTVLALLNQQLYRSTPAQKYATVFLGIYDQPTRKLTYSNAGHLPPIVICADGSSHLLDTGGTVVGLFGDMAYPEGRVSLDPGDILVAYSDGITEPENDFGDFGEERLIQLVRENRDLPLPRISDAILNAVIDWIGGAEQPDDMTVVLARAR